MSTFIFLMIVIVILCVLLIILVLSQNPKGGGLSGTFGGGGTQMFGVQRTNNFLDKATWTLSIVIALLIIFSSVVIPRDTSKFTPTKPDTQKEQPTTKEEPSVNPIPGDKE